MVVIILSESVLQPPNGVGSNPAAGRTELKNKMHNCLNFIRVIVKHALILLLEHLLFIIKNSKSIVPRR